MTEQEALHFLKSGYYSDSKLREAIRIVVAMAERSVIEEVPKVERKSRRVKEEDED